MTETTTELHSERLRLTAVTDCAERRGAPRARVAYVQCFSPAPGIIFNVSRTGVAIETFRSFEPGKDVFLTSELAGRPKRAYGNVRWCRQIATAGNSSSPVYQVGIALAEPLEERWLSALVEGPAASIAG